MGGGEIGGGHYYVFILVSLPRRLAPPSVFSYRFSLIFFEESVFFSFLFFIPFYLFIFFSPPPSLFKLNAKLYTLLAWLCVVLLVFLSRLSPISLLFAFHLALFLPLLSS